MTYGIYLSKAKLTCETYNPKDSFSRVANIINDNMTKANDANEKAPFCTDVYEESMTEEHFKKYLIMGRVIPLSPM